MRKINFLLIGLLIFSFSLNAETKFTAAEKAKNNFSKFKSNDFINLAKKLRNANSQNQSKIDQAKSKLNIQNNTQDLKQSENKIQASTNVWVPGEFDESQAVLISWPSYAYDAEGNPLEPFMDGYGWPYDGTDTLLKIEGYATDLFDDSPFPNLYKELVKAIQVEATAWIRLTNISDSIYVKSFLKASGVNLTNYLFFNQPEGENSFWMRDCGPYGYYYGDKDSLGLIGALYYPGRPIDNDISKFLANKFGYQYTQSNVETEGGNFMTDGWGRAFWSTVILDNNKDSYGRGYEYKDPMTMTQINAAMKSVFNLTNYNVLNKLYCDGGTGHIDLYLKLVDDETIITTQYPSYMNSSNFPDYAISKTNLKTIASLNSHYDRPYNIQYVDLPTKDDNSNFKDCEDLFYDARTYINGLSINKTFILPIYSNLDSGNIVHDNLAIERMKQILPGYTIYPIDARMLSVGGGEIHCITMQIPAENPLRIAHRRISGNQVLATKFDLKVTAANYSGIKSSILFWKKSNESSWKEVKMTSTDGSNFDGSISDNSITKNDTLNYYISVESNNGKVQNRPMPAPKGFYTFYFNSTTGIEEESITQNSLKVEPNPAYELANFKFYLNNSGNYQVSIENSLGISQLDIPMSHFEAGNNSIQINTSKLSSGIYFITLKNDNFIRTTKMIVIK